MWWLDPGKEVLNVVFNRILAPYVENLDLNQVNYGIAQGQLALHNLRLKKGALDKFRLPVDVVNGHLGKLSISLHWLNLGNKPAKILIEDVYLLVVPSPKTSDNPEEEENRAYAAKVERLENAELLEIRPQVETPGGDSAQTQGLLQSLIAKIINNIQITVKNIHVRYEDNLSVPGHPFAVGLTLGGFTAFSVNEEWQPAFIESTAGVIRKLANMESLAVYFDTDISSMTDLPSSEVVKIFSDMILRKDDANHQYILKPVSGEGRIIMNNKINQTTPRFDVQLFFDEIGVALDSEQYRDAISLLDMFHVYLRQRQYQKFWPTEQSLSPANSRLVFAGRAILEGIQERNRKWSWGFFAERRDDRNRYVELFEKKLLNTLSPTEPKDLEALERKLSYEDIRFYRSIARSRLRKDQDLRKRLDQEKSTDTSKQGWGGWLWNSVSTASTKPGEDSTLGKPITAQQRRELYEVLDFDEKAAMTESFETPREFLKTVVTAKLKKGSFALKNNFSGKIQDVISIVFDIFQANFLQRRDNFEVSLSLGGFGVFDGTTKSSLHPQIVRVKDKEVQRRIEQETTDLAGDPFFFLKFENNPLDGRADSALTARMRHMEIIYHKGYVEAIYNFLKPPKSQLESVEALLNAASRTIEGIRKETRAGLEFALQNHKTVDIQLDMSAPIIIIPEDITVHDCTHLIIDAGHISVESNLADKDAIRSIRLKQNQQYDDEDYRYLESLMYDKMSLKLEAAQFVIGTNMQSCLDALNSTSHDSLHLLERISLDLLVQNSIVPSVPNLPRFKVSGKLPSLRVNFSDVKYKSLLRLVDVCIPNFDDRAETAETASISHPPMSPETPTTFALPSAIFTPAVTEYNLGDDDSEDEGSSSKNILEASEGAKNDSRVFQRIVELKFQVDGLRASVFKSTPEGEERPLGDVSLQRFSMGLSLSQYDMDIDIKLRSLSMDLVQSHVENSLRFISSDLASEQDEDLLTIAYKLVQNNSPDLISVHEGINQAVDIHVSTFRFCAAPEPVISLYDFVMTTFVPPTEQQATTNRELQAHGSTPQSKASATTEQKIRVLIKLASVQLTLTHNGLDNFATLSLSTADVSILLLPRSLLVAGRLGSLALANDDEDYTVREEFNQILSILGENFVEFRYQTFDPDEESYRGIKTSVSLKAGSLKFTFLKEPLREIYLFVTKLARLKGIYDAATQAAVQTASTIEVDQMQFEVSVQTPILVFPSDPVSRRDALIMELGEISAQNTPEATTSRTVASLNGIRLVSMLYKDSQAMDLKMIENINISAEILQTSGIDRSSDVNRPDNQMTITISDIKLHLTQIQYGLLIQLSQAIPEVLAPALDTYTYGETAISVGRSLPEQKEATVALAPEVKIVSTDTDTPTWSALDLVVSVGSVKLHLYDGEATSEPTLKDHGIVIFAVNDSTLRFKLLSDGSGEAQLALRSFTINSTRRGKSKFREIIPAAQHDRNQFMILYTMSGSSNRTSFAVLTVDAPQMIFSIDPVIAVIEFFTSAFTTSQQSLGRGDQITVQSQQVSEGATIDFRVELHDISVTVLENDEDLDSQSIQLAVKRILTSQQGVLALSLEHMGMSLMRMGSDSESVRFLDDVDLTFSLDSRSSSSQQMTSMELSVKPIIFRASRGDLNLISSIINKAIASYNNSQQNSTQQAQGQITVQKSAESVNASVKPRQTIGNARALMSKEQLTGSFDGFRLVLIGDLHEQPMLHVKVKPFIIGAKDWSGELNASATIAMQISYWNLSNSHWEPLIDPWTFTATIARAGPNGGLKFALSARERLDLNVTTAFVDIVNTTTKVWATDMQEVFQKPRGTYAPYRIRNLTGSAIFVWSDVETGVAKELAGVKILPDQTIDWRFDDWKTMREHLSSGQHGIGIQFVGKDWEKLRSIPVDREGEYIYSLRPRTKYPNRLLCEIRVVDTVKIITIRSTYRIENQTLYPLELMLVDDAGRPIHGLEKVAPGHDYAVPIDAVQQCKIRIQPDQGFGYKWCPPIRWEDLVAKKGFTIRCPHANPAEAAFRFQAWVQTDAPDAVSRKFPKIDLKLRAPLELENLLPYNLEYRIYDKDTDQNWRSYLRKGGLMPIHSVELGHFVLLNINVQDTVFAPSEFAIINTDGHSDFETENRLVLKDRHNRQLHLRLNYVRYPESGGAFKVQISCPYIFINKTSLPFLIKSTRSTRAGSHDVPGDTRQDALSRPSPFLLSHPHESGHEFLFKVGDSGWSKIVSFEAPAADTALAIASEKQKNEEIHIGLSWAEGLGKYRLTKVVTMTPRFLIKNNLREVISFREHGYPPREGSLVEPGERRFVQVLRSSTEKLLTIAYPGLNAQWSPPINIQDIGSVHFRLRGHGTEGNDLQLVQADIKIDGPTIFISISRVEAWPFVIENQSEYLITFHQKDFDSGEKGSSNKALSMYTAQPFTNVNYAWDFPAARDKKIVLVINGARRMVDIMEIGTLVPFKFSNHQRTRAISLDVRADGYQQILRISNYHADQSIYKPRRSRQESVSSSSSMEAFEAVTDDASPTLTFSVELSGVGVSLVNKRMVEIIYATVDALSLEYSSSTVAQTFNLTCGSLQIDNQLHDASFPVIMQPTPIPKEESGVAAPPTVQASIIWLNDEEHGVLFIKYCSILLQALNIEADEDLLFALYDLTQMPGASWEDGADDLLIKDIETIPEPKDNMSGRELYFEVLELQPIKVSLSFVRSERTNSDEKLSLRNPLAVVLNALTMTVGNINDAPLELNALGLKDIRLTFPELQSRIIYHYRQDVLRQLYRILGSADFIGNPVGLFTNVSSGVADIFYEPFHGVVVHGNKELGIGIAKGAASFVKKTVFGVSDSVTKFTSSVGKGLSAATFDPEYQARRRLAQRRNKPRHAIYGVAAGGEALASSVTSAMEGVLMKPIEGAERGGALGFFKGVGKGLVGAVTKPVVGVFDLASNVSEGIRNTTTVFDNPERDRVRLPRPAPADGVLRPYSAREALGQYWMRDLNSGAYRQDSYVAHISSTRDDNVVILTVSRVLSFWSRNLRPDWELSFVDIQGVTVEDTGIRFAHKSGKDQDKFVFIPDKGSQSWFFTQVGNVVKAFNAKKRMDL